MRAASAFLALTTLACAAALSAAGAAPFPLAAGLEPKPPLLRAQAAATNLNVAHVGYVGGEFIRTDFGDWIEQGDNGAAFNFVEDSRSVGGVLLYDGSRDVWITLDVEENVIWYRQGEAMPNQKLYDIIWSVAAPPQPLFQDSQQQQPLFQDPPSQPLFQETSCPPGTQPVPETDNCIAVDDGFAVAPWENPVCPGLQQRCDSGDGAACTEYEETCQVN